MTAVAAVAAIILALVFLISGVAKLRDLTGARAAAADLGVPSALAGVVGTALPFVEIGCALLLVTVDPLRRIAAVIAGLMLVAFTAVIVGNLLRGRRPECRCFGALSEGGISWWSVARNAALLTLVGLVLAGQDAGAPLTALAALQGTDRWILLLSLVLLAGLAVAAVVLRQVTAGYGEVLLRLEHLERYTGLAAPEPAPDFELPDLDGQPVSLAKTVAGGKPALVVFVSPTCRHCAELTPALSAWQQDPAARLDVLVVSDGSVEANRAKFGGDHPVRVLLDDNLRTAQDYRVQGTPAAVAVDADGTLRSPLVHGPEAILALREGLLGHAGHQHGGGEGGELPLGLPLHEIGERPPGFGEPIPADVVLVDGAGRQLTTEEALGDEAVLVFWRNGCGYCQQIAPRLRELEHTVPLRLVTETPEHEVRELGLTSPVLQDPGSVLGNLLRVPGTPSAALVRKLVVASGTAIGGDQVLQLVRTLARQAADHEAAISSSSHNVD